MTRNRGGWNILNAERTQEAFTLRMGGETYEAIGARFGVSKTAVRIAFKRNGIDGGLAPRCRLHDSNGYLCAVLPPEPGKRKGRVEFAHRLVMEFHLGRPLESGEVVHHRDENKRNNALSNLVLTTHSAHALEHHPGVDGIACERCSSPAWQRRSGRALCRKCYNHQRRYHEQSNACAGSRKCPFAG